MSTHFKPIPARGHESIVHHTLINSQATSQLPTALIAGQSALKQCTTGLPFQCGGVLSSWGLQLSLSGDGILPKVFHVLKSCPHNLHPLAVSHSHGNAALNFFDICLTFSPHNFDPFTALATSMRILTWLETPMVCVPRIKLHPTASLPLSSLFRRIYEGDGSSGSADFNSIKSMLLSTI